MAGVGFEVGLEPGLDELRSLYDSRSNVQSLTARKC
jgi:hypothetical protein